MKQRGFTLLELILVLAIIAISITLAIPRLSNGESTRLQSKVRETAAALKYARRTALIFNQETNITISVNDKKTTDKKIPKQVLFYPGGGSSGGEFHFYENDIEATIDVNPLTGKITIDFPDK
jgi:prepilin-type N-terminal cleavage/methylation domain-containing protein